MYLCERSKNDIFILFDYNFQKLLYHGIKKNCYIIKWRTWCKINGIVSKDFIDNPENKGLLPVRGTIPDMFSDSERYIKLLNIYRNKAVMDAEQVYRRVQTHLESIGRSPVSKFNHSLFARS